MQAIFIIFIAFCYVQIAHADLSMEESYDKIEEHLCKKVKSDDVSENFAEAAKWLKKLEKKSKSCFTLHSGEIPLKIEALNQFLALRNVLDSTACTSESARLIKENGDAARMSPRVERQPTRRIEKIVHHCAKMHYDMCYFDKLSQIFTGIDMQTLKLVYNIGRSALPLSLVGRAINFIQISRINMAIAANKTRNELVWANHHVTEDEFRTFLINPCKELERHSGSNFKIGKSHIFFFYGVSSEEVSAYDVERNAINNCVVILELENEIYSQMEKCMNDK